MKPNLSQKELVDLATGHITRQGYFLLLYDVIASKAFTKKYSAKEMYRILGAFHQEVNDRCGEHIVQKRVAIDRMLSSFGTIVGDGGGGYFGSAEVIEPILILSKKLPFSLRWGVAPNGWDEENTKILK